MAFQYANRQKALEPGQEVDIVMFKVVPGESRHIQEKTEVRFTLRKASYANHANRAWIPRTVMIHMIHPATWYSFAVVRVLNTYGMVLVR